MRGARSLYLILFLVSILFISSCVQEGDPQSSPGLVLYIDSVLGTGETDNPFWEDGVHALDIPLRGGDFQFHSDGDFYVTTSACRLSRTNPSDWIMYNYIIGDVNLDGYSGRCNDPEDGTHIDEGKVGSLDSVVFDSNNNIAFVATIGVHEHEMRHMIRFIPRTDGTYFGQQMLAEHVYTILPEQTGQLIDNLVFDSTGNLIYDIHIYPTDTSGTLFKLNVDGGSSESFVGNGEDVIGGCSDPYQEGRLAINTPIYGARSRTLAIDSQDNIYWTDTTWSVWMVPKVSGTYFGKDMQANYIYNVAGIPNCNQGTVLDADGKPVREAYFETYLGGIAFDSEDNMYLRHRSDKSAIFFVPNVDMDYYGRQMQANYVYRIIGTEVAGDSGDGGLAIEAQLGLAGGKMVFNSGSLYIKDNLRLREVYPAEGTLPPDDDGPGDDGGGDGGSGGGGGGSGSNCGDSYAEGSEECDMDDLDGETCISLGYDLGTLACYEEGHARECEFDKSGCSYEEVEPVDTGEETFFEEVVATYPKSKVGVLWVFIILAAAVATISVVVARKKNDR